MAKFKTVEEAKEALKTTKEEAKVARDEKRTFEKENSLAKDTDHSGDAKLGKKWTKLNDMWAKKKKAVEEIDAVIAEFKANKPSRVSSYDYPKDVVTAADKKKYRAKARAKAKSEAKAEAKGEKGNGEKSSSKDKSSKKDKSKKEKKAEKVEETAGDDEGSSED